MSEPDFICTSCDEPCEESEINEKGECPECAMSDWGTCHICGERFSNEELHGDPPRCEDCLIDEGYCTSCAGTGEGQVDGSRCSRCGGSGQVTPAGLDEPDPPDPDDSFTTDKDFGPYGYSPD